MSESKTWWPGDDDNVASDMEKLGREQIAIMRAVEQERSLWRLRIDTAASHVAKLLDMTEGEDDYSDRWALSDQRHRDEARAWLSEVKAMKVTP